ncbi:MAG: flippase-like domain-containing protein [Deltaproteobacteria bacterium]|nr:flippase-like domain-containing protein [Deltaproteobacteria bacterium]
MNRLKVKRYWVWLFLIISGLAAILILKNIPPGELAQGLKIISPSGLLGALSAVLIMWVADAMRLKVLSRAAGSNIGVATGLRLVWGGLLFSGITPFEFGGGAYQILLMNKKGLSSAESTAIITTKGLLAMIVLLVMAPVVLCLYPGVLPHSAFKYLMVVTCTLMSISSTIMVISCLRPMIVTSTGHKILSVFFKAHIIHRPTKTRWDKAWSVWADQCHSSFITIFRKGSGIYMTAATICTFVFLLGQFAVAPLLLIGAGIHIDMWQLILLQFPLTVLLYFIPTPGSSGVAEGGFYVIFASFAPPVLIGMLTLMWRFLTFYLGMILGMIFVPVRAE